MKAHAAATTAVLSAGAASALGDGILLATLPLLAAQATRDPRGIGLVIAMTTLPWLLLGLIGGALVDRWDRRRAMAWASLTRGVLLVCATAVVGAGHATLPVLAATAFALGCGQIIFDSALDAHIPTLVGRDRRALMRLGSHQRITRTAAEAVGPGLGGILFGVGRATPLAADAIACLSSALIAWTLPRTAPSTPPMRRAVREVVSEIRQGVRYLRTSSLLLAMSVRPALGNMGFTACATVLVVIAETRLGLDSGGFGLLLSAQAVGGLAGAFGAPFLSDRIGAGRLLTITATMEGVAFVALAVLRSAPLAFLAMGVLGFAIGTTMTISPAIRQAIVPSHLMGRVSSAGRTVGLSGAPVGALVGGTLGGSVGLTAPLWFGAALLLATAVIAARWTSDAAIGAALLAAEVRESDDSVAPAR